MPTATDTELYAAETHSSDSPGNGDESSEQVMDSRPNGSLPATLTIQPASLTALIHNRDYAGLRKRLASRVKTHELHGALFWASNSGYAEAVKILLQSGANVNAADQFGATVLHHAVQGQHEDVITALLKAGARFSEWTMEGETLLHWASRIGFVSVVECLISLNACVTTPDSAGRHPLHLACQNGQHEVIPIFLSHRLPKQASCDTIYEDESEEEEGKSTYASTRPSVRMAHPSNFRNCTDVNLVDENGWTPLHYACTSHNPRTPNVVRQLVKFNANPLCQTHNGKTALDLAFECGRDHLFLSILSIGRILSLLIKVDDIKESTAEEKDTVICGQPVFKPSVGDDDDDFEDEVNAGRENMNRVRRHYSFLVDDFHRLSVSKSRALRGRTRYVESRESISRLKDWSTSSIWRHILQNDDKELLGILRNFRIHEHEISNQGNSHINFEDMYTMPNDMLSEIHMACFENGLAIFSYIRGHFRQQLDDMDYKEIFRKLTKFNQRDVVPDKFDDCIVMWPLSTSVLFIAVLCGRFKIVEMLLRMRQFDILPTTLVIILILRNLEDNAAFTEQAKSSMKKFAANLEVIAMDVLNRIFLRDNSEGKFSSINFINTRLSSIGGYTVIDIAAQASCTDFLSLPCSQVVLYNSWYGKLHWLPYSWRVVSKICPFILPIYAANRQVHVRRLSNYSRRLSSFETANRQTLTTHILGKDCPGKARRHHESIEDLSHSSCLDKVKMIKHAFTSPSNKFFYHSLVHTVFLFLFSYVLLYDFHFYISPMEIVCITFVFGYAVEEGRQFVFHVRERKLTEFFTDTWNKLDLAAIVICTVGFVTRAQVFATSADVPATELVDYVLYAARVILLTGLLVFYVRILFVLSLFPRLGPKLRMMFAMVWYDLLPMLSIFLLFLVSFGIMFQGILFPNGYDLTNQTSSDNYERQSPGVIISNIVKKSFYGMMAAEYNVQMLEESGFGNCDPSAPCGQIILAGRALMLYGFKILYVLIVNIMLVNLLIALYSHTVALINEKSTAHWLADNYSLVHEFRQRSVCPPPLNILSIIVELILCCCRRKRNAYRQNQSTCTCKVIRYLMIQGFALKDQRYKIGLQETQVISERLTSLEKSMSSISSSLKQLLRERRMPKAIRKKQRVMVYE